MNIPSTVQTENRPEKQGETRMTIIGIIASPRKKGNTAFIVNKMLEGAKEQGAETSSFSFSDLTLKPCQGCLSCHKTDRGCVVDDDMQKIYAAIEEADVVILGSPIYMGQMSAQAKIITDRLFAQISPRFSPHFKEKATKKKMVLTFNQGNPDSGMFQTYIDYTKHMFELLEFDVIAVPVVTGLRNGPAHERDDLHTSLKAFGSALISE